MNARGLALALLLFVAAPPAAAQERASAALFRYDYFLLALSWSPAYCAESQSQSREALQCGPGRRRAFIVHGLWPQSDAGRLPMCAPVKPTDVAPALLERQLDLMPSRRLVEAQWDRHGACAGLSQDGYFGLLRTARQNVKIPPVYQALDKSLSVSAGEVKAQFAKVNPGLTAAAITVTCEDGRLREVRICVDRKGAFRSCGRRVRDRCEGRAAMLPIR